MATQYKKSFLSEFYPGTLLSKNYGSQLFDVLGQDLKLLRQFYKLRIDNVRKEHHIAIDGTLKQNNSVVNDLSHFSYKSRAKGTKDISVLYAYDVELKEPICATVYPGNSVVTVSYKKFIKDNNLVRGIIIDDKGFPVNTIRELLAQTPNLHYLTPIKRNDKRIEKYDVLKFTEIVPEIERHVVGNKVKLRDNTFLYAFKDIELASSENSTYLARTVKDKEFDADKHEKITNKFGVIIFESDVDLSLKDAYLTYESRWLLEAMFKQYKSNEALKETRVQEDFTVIGYEFVNFISTLI